MSVAVNDLDPKGIDMETADVISDRLRTELFKTGFFTVVERGQMEEILKEQGFQQSGCISDACSVEMGQLLGVANMIAGTIGKVGETFTINLRLIDVGTGKILFTANIDLRGKIDDVLSKSTVDIAKKLVENIYPTDTVQTMKKEQKEKETVIKKGKLTVITEPTGATVLLNLDKKGMTPYSDSAINVGEYALAIKMLHYTPINKSIKIVAGETLEKHYKLKRTKSYIISEKASEKKVSKSKAAVSRKKKIWTKVVSGVISVASGVVGLAKNAQAQEKKDEYMAIEDNYQNSNTNSNSNSNYDEYSKQYTAAYNEAEEKIRMRNICYIVAGVGLVSFAVSFAF